MAEEIRADGRDVAAVRAAFPDIVISIDTWRAEVAVEAVAAGADLLNDTWAGADPALAEVAAATGAGLVCSHAGGLAPRTRPHRAGLRRRGGGRGRDGHRARRTGGRRSGYAADGILIDPAHDFGKNTRHSLEITRRLDELAATGWPVLVALSNKDFVGETLDLPVDERLEGTLAATAVSAWLGARVFRAHQVRPTRRVLDMVAVDPGRPAAGRLPPRPGLTAGRSADGTSGPAQTCLCARRRGCRARARRRRSPSRSTVVDPKPGRSKITAQGKRKTASTAKST